MWGTVTLSGLNAVSQKKGFGTATDYPTVPCRFLGRQHTDGQSLFQTTSDALAVRIESRMSFSMSLHSNMGICTGRRKPALDLPGHQDIANPAKHIQKLELSYGSFIVGEQRAIVEPSIIRSVASLK